MKAASAFPRLAIADAEIYFDADDYRPRMDSSLRDVAAALAEGYLAQVKQRWWWVLLYTMRLSGLWPRL